MDPGRIPHDSLSSGAESSKSATFSPEPESIPDSDAASVSSIKRSKRPPDLDLSTSKDTTVLTPEKHQNVTVEASASKGGVEVGAQLERGSQGDFDPTQSSTPTKHSESISERVSLMNKNPCKFLSVVLNILILILWRECFYEFGILQIWRVFGDLI